MMKKKGILVVLLLVMLLQALPVAAFSDLGGYEWCEEAVTYLSEKGLLRGTAGSAFSPGDSVIRGDFAVLAVRIFGLNAENIPENFSDVTPEMYYYHPIGILKLYQLVSGTDWNHYNPEQHILRQDMAVLLWRLMNKLGYTAENHAETVLGAYSDGQQIEQYARVAVAYLVEKGIMTGKPDGKLYPLHTVNRAEMAVMMARIYKYLEQSYGN